jgi:hypothetical protein
MVFKHLSIIEFMLALCVAGISVSCQNYRKPSMTIEQARLAVEKAIPRLTDLPEPLGSNWSDYVIDDIADVNGDGVYEVALTQKVEGSMGSIGGHVFRLEGDRLVYIHASRKLGRGQGNIHFKEGKVILTSPAWGPEDAHCCPSLKVIEIYDYNNGQGFALISIDTTKANQSGT